MSNQDFRQSSSQNSSNSQSSSSGSGATGYGSDMLAKASEIAGEAANKVKQSASETAASVGGEVKHLLDRQVSGGAQMVEQLATTAKHAADELDREAPQLAGVVRAVADRMEDYAGNLQNLTVDELVKTASDFTRRQPALMFGLAALAGFMAMRTFKAVPATGSSVSSPSIQPSHPGRSSRSFHGA